MFVAGLLANCFGGKRVLGYSVLAWSIFTLLTPPAATLSIAVLVAGRIGTGVGEAGMFPATYELFGRWVPPTERGRAVAFMTSGVPVGTLIGLTGSGWLVQRYGWAMPFYVFGSVGLLWLILWFRKVENDPAGRGGALRRNMGPLLRQEMAEASSSTMAPQAGTTNTRDLTPDPAGYQVDDLIIDLAPRRVRRAGTVIPLKALSFDLLVTLVRAAPHLVSFEQLSERIWPGLVVTPETIVQRVKLLRSALGDDPHAPRYIEGVRGRGYRMVAEVRPMTERQGTPESIEPPSLKETKEEESPNMHAGIAAAGAAIGSSPSAPPPAPSRPAKGVPLGWIGGTLVSVVLLAASWAITHYRAASNAPQRTSSGTAPAAIHSLAVLPLENLSGDK